MIPQKKTIKLIQKLYNKGISVLEISKIAEVPYSTAYSLTRLKDKGYNKCNEYLKDWVIKKGYKSLNEYKKYRANQRQQQSKNKKFSKLIKKELEKINKCSTKEELKKIKNQNWLAKEAGVTRSMMSLYIQGKSIPSEDKLEKMCSALKIRYNKLERILRLK